MNYIGSKKSLLEFLEKSIISVVKRKNSTFSDLFAWTWIVGRFFKEKGYKVIANDYKRFKAGKDRNFKKDSVLEYLHYVKIK